VDQATAEHLEDYQFLHQPPFFNLLSKNALWPLTTLFVHKHFEHGDFLLEEGSDPIGVFILKTGHVHVLKKSSFGAV
jgi:CRP/FNR family cyclic AMP-dependent transcriptional regulator